MNLKKAILPLLALTLVACNNNNNSNSGSLPPSTTSTSTSTSIIVTPPSISTTVAPSILPSVSISNKKSVHFTFDELKDSLPTTSSSEETKVTFQNTQLGVVSCNYGTYSGSGYLMMRKTSDTNGAGHIYNLDSLENITSVVVKFSASTSENAILGAKFGETPMTSSIDETGLQEKASANKIVTFTNTNSKFGCFNLSVMNNYNCQIVEMVININGSTTTIS